MLCYTKPDNQYQHRLCLVRCTIYQNSIAEILTAKVTPLRELVEVVEAGDAMEE